MKRFWTAAVTALVITLGLALVSGSWISTAGGHASMIGPMTMAWESKPDADRNCGRLVHAQDDSALQLCVDRRGQRRQAATRRAMQSMAKRERSGTPGLSLTAAPYYDQFARYQVRFHTHLNLPRARHIVQRQHWPVFDFCQHERDNLGSAGDDRDLADDKSRKTAAFSTVSARYVRLTALTEAGGRGPDTSAAAIGLSGGEAADGPGAVTYRLDGFG